LSYVRTSGNITEQVTYQQQADVNFNQAGAVQNTWYTVLNTLNGRLEYIRVGCTVANETVEFRATIDGTIKLGANNCNFGSLYEILPDLAAINNLNFDGTATNYLAYRGLAGILEGHRVLIEVRKTTNAGASALVCTMIHHKRVN